MTNKQSIINKESKDWLLMLGDWLFQAGGMV